MPFDQYRILEVLRETCAGILECQSTSRIYQTFIFNNDNSDLYLLTVFLQGSFTSVILTKTNCVVRMFSLKINMAI